MYVIQTLLVAFVLTVMCWRTHLLHRFQIVGWTSATLFLASRFGDTGQLVVYSSDQSIYFNSVMRIMADGPPLAFPSSLSWWLLEAQTPYVMPGVLLSMAGLHPAVALKTVSLLSILGLTSLVGREIAGSSFRQSAIVGTMTATGVIGIFFSVWALRDATLMLTTTTVFVGRGRVRLVALFVTAMMRPHLAAALAAGLIVAVLWNKFRSRGSWSIPDTIATITVGAVLGPLMLSFGENMRRLVEYSLESGSLNTVGLFDASPELIASLGELTRYVSTLVGLQFLTASDNTVTLSIQSLLLARIGLAELWLIPTLFFLCLILKRTGLAVNERWLLVSFATYTALGSTTDFSSARQNLPFLPYMGVLLFRLWRGRNATVVAASPSRSLGTSN